MDDEGITIQLKSVKPGFRELKKARDELKPVVIEPELSEFLREYGFKEERRLTAELRANVQASMRKALNEPGLKFLTGYMRGNLMIWLFEGFWMVGGRIVLDDKPENAEFFNILTSGDYHVFMQNMKITAYLDHRRVHDIQELKQLCEENIKLVSMQNTVGWENIIKEVEEESNDPAKRRNIKILEPPSSLAKTMYTPDEATEKFLAECSIEYLEPETFSCFRRFFEHNIRDLFRDNGIQPISFYRKKEERVWLVRAQNNWKVYGEIIASEPKREGIRAETEARYGRAVDYLFIAPGAMEFTMTLYPVGTANTLAELRALYEDAKTWQSRQVK